MKQKGEKMDLDQLKGKIPDVIIEEFFIEENKIKIVYEEKDFEEFMLTNGRKCDSTDDIDNFIVELIEKSVVEGVQILPYFIKRS